MHDVNATVYSVKYIAGLKKFYKCRLSPRFAFISIVTRGPQASYNELPYVRMYSLLTTFAERKNIFLLLFLEESINQILASNKDFMRFFCNIFISVWKKIPWGRARKTKNQVVLALRLNMPPYKLVQLIFIFPALKDSVSCWSKLLICSRDWRY